MKRYAVLFLTCVVLSGLSGCKKNEDNGVEIGSQESSSNEQTEEDGKTSVSIGTIEDEQETDNSEDGSAADTQSQDVTDEPQVQVYFPAGAFNTTDEKTIKSDAGLMGATAQINEDGSVVYTMSKSNRDKQMELTKNGLTEICRNLASDGRYDFIKNIELNENLTEIFAKVDKDAFLAQKSTFKDVADKCLGYQAFDGVKPDELKATVHIIDDATGAEFETAVYDVNGRVKD